MPATNTTDPVTPSVTAVRAFAVASLAAASVAVDVLDPRRTGICAGKVWHYEGQVVLGADGYLSVHVTEDAVLTAKASRALMVATRDAVRVALAEAGIDARLQTFTQNGKKFNMRTTGFWHMNQFCCNGRTVRFRVAGELTA